MKMATLYHVISNWFTILPYSFLQIIKLAFLRLTKSLMWLAFLEQTQPLNLKLNTTKIVIDLKLTYSGQFLFK